MSGLAEKMQEQPGMMALFIAEWVAIVLLGVACLAVMFLIAVGAYSLVGKMP